MKTCADFRGQMFAYVRGELLALERAHVESHIERCRSCASLEKKCARSLEALDAYAPRSEVEHVERLKKRLVPYVAAGKPSRPSYVPIASALAAAAAITAVLIFMPRDEVAEESVPELAAETARDLDPPALPVLPAMAIEAAVRHELSPNLHVIAAREWDGRVVSNRPEDLRVEMKTGFAVMAFKGGAGRKLTVVAPNVEVEVVGTKFFVHVLANGHTAVGVVSGSVRVRSAQGNELVEAGGSRAFGAVGPSIPAEAAATPAIDLEDPFIEDHGHDPEPVVPVTELVESTAVPKTSVARPKLIEKAEPAEKPIEETKVEEAPKEPEEEKEPEDTQPDLPAVTAAGLLAEAERLVSAGRVDEALHLYDWALASEDEAIRSKRSLYRYEMARLLGFEKNERAKARDIFERLALTASGEVRTQAAFAVCELELAESACNAATCLRAIAADRSIAPEVAQEAKGLVSRWKLDSCR